MFINQIDSSNKYTPYNQACLQIIIVYFIFIFILQIMSFKPVLKRIKQREIIQINQFVNKQHHAKAYNDKFIQQNYGYNFGKMYIETALDIQYRQFQHCCWFGLCS